MIVPLLPMGCSPTTARMLGTEKRYHHHGGAPGIVAAALRRLFRVGLAAPARGARAMMSVARFMLAWWLLDGILLCLWMLAMARHRR